MTDVLSSPFYTAWDFHHKGFYGKENVAKIQFHHFSEQIVFDRLKCADFSRAFPQRHIHVSSNLYFLSYLKKNKHYSSLVSSLFPDDLVFYHVAHYLLRLPQTLTQALVDFRKANILIGFLPLFLFFFLFVSFLKNSTSFLTLSHSLLVTLILSLSLARALSLSRSYTHAHTHTHTHTHSLSLSLVSR